MLRLGRSLGLLKRESDISPHPIDGPFCTCIEIPASSEHSTRIRSHLVEVVSERHCAETEGDTINGTVENICGYLLWVSHFYSSLHGRLG